MITRTDGLVIREQTTGEQDRLVTVLTREMGVIRAFVNGGRNPKNKNVAATGLLCYSDFSIYRTSKGVCIIKEATPKQVFFALREDIIRLSLAQYFAELAYELSPREENADEFLRLILNSVYLICGQKRDSRIVKAATELRLLSLAGYMPSIVACDNCGEYESENMYFSINTGRLFCQNCKPEEKTVKVGLGVIAAMRHICFSAPEKVFSFSLSKDGIMALEDLSERYLKAVTMKNYKTLDFYKTMTQ
ncbi:MAG: DNA repair protein RecO [Faecalibacterium sp.]|nr:DNA repair protein RecO [Ruminococcus sp.]MCM1392508.1 DNA repair protein RecO [Ruminococcus sp.]MCM1486093.1 DNA repair protein RecO [Faecalibacterium sp.]